MPFGVFIHHTYLDDALVLLQYILRFRQVPTQVVRYCKRNPVLPKVGPQPEKGMPRLYKPVVKPELSLKVRGIAKDVHVILPIFG